MVHGKGSKRWMSLFNVHTDCALASRGVGPAGMLMTWLAREILPHSRNTYPPPLHMPFSHIRVWGVQLTLFASPFLSLSLILSSPSSFLEPLKTRANNKALYACMHFFLFKNFLSSVFLHPCYYYFLLAMTQMSDLDLSQKFIKPEKYCNFSLF